MACLGFEPLPEQPLLLAEEDGDRQPLDPVNDIVFAQYFQVMDSPDYWKLPWQFNIYRTHLNTSFLVS